MIKNKNKIAIGVLLVCVLFLSNVSFASEDINPNLTNNAINNNDNVSLPSLNENNDLTDAISFSQFKNLTVIASGWSKAVNETNKNFTGQLLLNNESLPNFNVSVKLTNLNNNIFKVYNLTTDTEGYFILPINLAVGYYNVETYPVDFYKYNNHYRLSENLVNVCTEGTKFPNGDGELTRLDSVGLGISVRENYDLVMSYGDEKSFTCVINSIYSFNQRFNIKAEFIRLSDNANKVYDIEIINNQLSIPVNLAPGNYKINLYSSSDSLISSNYILIANKTFDKINTFLDCDLDSSNYFVGFLKSFSFDPLNNQVIKINITRNSDGLSKNYFVTTNDDGLFTLPINLGQGKYTFICSYNGTDIYSESIYNSIRNI